MLFKAKSHALEGVKLATCNPGQKHLHFLPPRLNKKGEPLRQAQKALGEYETKQAKARKLRETSPDEAEAFEKQNNISKENEHALQIAVAIESLKQQYTIEYQTDEEKAAYNGDPNHPEAWKELFGECFTEGDLDIIMAGINTGKAFTRESLWDWMNSKAAEQLKKTAS